MFVIDNIVNLIDKVLDKTVGDKNLKETISLKLTELAQTGELAKMTNDLDVFKTEAGDKDSARKRESEIATSEKAPLINKIITPILALSCLGISFLFFGLVVFNANLIQGFNRDALMFILGLLSSMDMAVVGYYFGSSMGSKEKDKTLLRK